MSSASFKPGERTAIRGAGACCSRGTATASARKPAARLSPRSKKKRNSRGRSIASDANRGFRAFTFLWEDNPEAQKPKRHYDFSANQHLFLNHSRCPGYGARRLAARGQDAARPNRSKKAADADDRGISAKVHAGHQGAPDRPGEI